VRIGVAAFLCVPFLAVGPAHGAELAVTPESLAFVGLKGGATPAAQTLTVDTPSQSGRAWTASEARPWLAVAPADGVTPATTDVTITDFASLNEGAYSGEITVAAPDVTGSPRVIPVTLDVLSQASLLTRPSSLKFDAVQGQASPAAQSVKVLYPYAAIEWTATTGAAWLVAAPTGASTPGTATISVNPTGLAPGTYQASVELAEKVSGTSAAVTVQLVVQPAGGMACASNAWYCASLDDLALGSIDGQAGWVSNDAVAKAQVAADPRGTGKVLVLDPPDNEVSNDLVVLDSQPIDLTEIALQVRLNNLPADKRQVGKLEFYTSGDGWGKTKRTFGAIRMAGGVLYFQYGANVYTKIVDGAESNRFYDVKIQFRGDTIDVLVDGVKRFTTTNPMPGTQSVQAFSATGWYAPGSASIDLLQARTMPATPQPELFVDPLILNFSGAQVASATAGEAGTSYASAPAATLPMAFEPNVGQVDGGVRFVARGAGYSVRIEKTGAALELGADRSVALRLVGASDAEPTGEQPLPGRSHYLVGSDPARWKRDIPQFGRVRYEQVYPGVDAVFYGNQRRLEYDFEVAPGADPGAIRMRFEGARDVRVDEQGDLIVSTPGGDLRQHKPIAYQPAGVRHDPVAATYAVEDDRAVSVRVASYDPARPLVIDPVLTYSTKLGGSQDDQAVAIAVDKDGSTYIAGHTTSADFPVATTIQPQKDTNGSDTDVFITKLNPCGTAIVYSTYLGGGGDDLAAALVVDAAGAVYVAGTTASSDFPVVSALQSVDPTSGPDGFVARLEPDGADLAFSTYLGGDAAGGATWPSSVRLDGSRLFVAGATAADTLAGRSPARVNAVPASGGTNPFVARLSLDGQTIDALVYLNSGCMVDVSTTRPSMALDAAGNVFVSGSITGCSSLPAPADRAINPFPISPLGWLSAAGDAGVFVTKLNAASLISVVYSSLFGGSGTELARALAVGPDGAAYVAGSVGPPADAGVELPTTGGAIWTTHSGTGTDGFLVKLRPDGTGPEYSTYLGRSAVSEVMRGVAVDGTGRAYVVGNSSWDSFPADKCAAKANYGGVTGTALLLKVDPTGGTLEDCVFLGPAGIARAVALDSAGAVYVTGSAAQNTFFTTPGAFQSTGTDEAFVAKLSNAPAAPVALIELSHSSYGVAENAGQATVTVRRTGRTTDAVDVTYATADGTAGSLDYTGVSNTLTFAPGETSRTFNVPVLDDAVAEPTETVHLTLSSPTNCAGLGPQKTAILSLMDDDGAQSGLSKTFIVRDRYLAQGPDWTATVQNAPWLTLSASSGTGPSTVTATASVAGLAPGLHTGTIRITAPGALGSPATVQVNLVVSAP
jgi:hypothetical protein